MVFSFFQTGNTKNVGPFNQVIFIQNLGNGLGSFPVMKCRIGILIQDFYPTLTTWKPALQVCSGLLTWHQNQVRFLAGKCRFLFIDKTVAPLVGLRETLKNNIVNGDHSLHRFTRFPVERNFIAKPVVDIQIVFGCPAAPRQYATQRTRATFIMKFRTTVAQGPVEIRKIHRPLGIE